MSLLHPTLPNEWPIALNGVDFLGSRYLGRQVRRRNWRPMFLIHRSRLGGIARGRKLSAQTLSEIGRNAINSRWQRHREALSVADKEEAASIASAAPSHPVPPLPQ